MSIRPIKAQFLSAAPRHSPACPYCSAGSETNILGFAYGRLAAHDPALVEEIAGLEQTVEPPGEKSLDKLMLEREQYLGKYQNSAYGKRYRDLVDTARTAELQIDGAGEAFTRAVAEGFFQIMAYKDEYEIARLLTDKSSMRQVRSQFSGDLKIKFHLAPPLFVRPDRKTGKIRKIAFGVWIKPVRPVAWLNCARQERCNCGLTCKVQPDQANSARRLPNINDN